MQCKIVDNHMANWAYMYMSENDNSHSNIHIAKGARNPIGLMGPKTDTWCFNIQINNKIAHLPHISDMVGSVLINIRTSYTSLYNIQHLDQYFLEDSLRDI